MLLAIGGVLEGAVPVTTCAMHQQVALGACAK